MRHGCQVILAIVANDPGVGAIELRIGVVELQDLQFSVWRSGSGKDVLPGFCSGRSATRKKEPRLVVEPEDAGVQQAFHFHALNAGPDVGRPQDRVFGKAFRDVSHGTVLRSVRVAHDDVVDQRSVCPSCSSSLPSRGEHYDPRRIWRDGECVRDRERSFGDIDR